MYSLDENGLLQATNIYTGEITLVEAGESSPAAQVDLEKYQRIRDSDGNLVYVPKNISVKELEKIQGRNRSFPYTQLLGDQICEHVAEGKTLPEIARMPGMPTYAQIARWRRQHPDFDEGYKMARKDRAEIYFHKLITEIEQATADRNEIALARLRADMYKFAAKVCSPDEYVEKQTLDAKVAVGTFSIETGIRREGDAGFVIDETLRLAGEDNTALEGD